MLKLYYDSGSLDIDLLVKVYEDSIKQTGKSKYRNHTEYEQYYRAEADFAAYLRVFLEVKGSFIAVWCTKGCYTAALRMEPHTDGFLLTALETAPSFRAQGYASVLMQQTLEHMKTQKLLPVYSHVKTNNKASFAVHKKCGFQIYKDYAVYLDGSVFTDAMTLIFR